MRVGWERNERDELDSRATSPQTVFPDSRRFSTLRRCGIRNALARPARRAVNFLSPDELDRRPPMARPHRRLHRPCCAHPAPEHGADHALLRLRSDRGLAPRRPFGAAVDVAPLSAGGSSRNQPRRRRYRAASPPSAICSAASNSPTITAESASSSGDSSIFPPLEIPRGSSTTPIGRHRSASSIFCATSASTSRSAA